VFAAFADSDPSIRRAAIDALRKIGPAHSDTIPTLTRALQDPDDEVRSDAARELGHLIRPDSGPPYAALLDYQRSAAKSTDPERGDRARRQGSTGALMFAPDAMKLAELSGNGKIAIWDRRMGERKLALDVPSQNVTTAALSNDFRLLAQGRDNGDIDLWDVETGKKLNSFRVHTDEVWCLAFTADGKALASGSYDGAIKVWDIDSGKERAYFSGHKFPVRSLLIAPDGKALISWAIGPTRVSWAKGLSPGGPGFEAVELRAWDLDSGRERAAFQIGKGITMPAVFMPSDQTLVSCAVEDQRLKVQRLKVTRLALDTGEALAVNELNFRNDPIPTWAGTVVVAVPFLLVREKSMLVRVPSLALAPDGKTLAVSSAETAAADGRASGKLTLWEVASGKQVATIDLGSTVAWSLAFAPDGKTVASRDASGTVQIWDVATGNKIGK
jgi:WD40 repeat protein